MTKSGTIRVGIGGWTFEPWDGTFYPDGLAKKRQLEHASRALRVIEVNGTYYSTQKPKPSPNGRPRSPTTSSSP